MGQTSILTNRHKIMHPIGSSILNFPTRGYILRLEEAR